MFLIIKTRLNISIFAILIVSYFVKNPNYIYLKVIKIKVKYLKKFEILFISKIF